MTEAGRSLRGRAAVAWRPVRSWWRTHVAPTAAWRAATRFFRDDMGDRAGSLSYHAALALFPALLVGLTLLGLIGEDGLVQDVTRFARRNGADTPTAQVVETLARSATQASSGPLTLALLVSLFLSLNAASGVWGAAGRALNAAHGVHEERGLLERRLTIYGLTTAAVGLFLLAVAAILLGGDWARALFGEIGLGQAAKDVWEVLRWPLALALALAALSLVWRFAPAPQARRQAIVTTGALVTVALWIAGTLGFAVYLSNFGRYGAVYGVFSTLIVLLLWLYLLSVAFLYGALLDGELHRDARGAAAAHGPPPPAET